jgi:hypothetical protein
MPSLNTLALETQRYSCVSRLKWEAANPTDSDTDFNEAGSPVDNPEGFARLDRVIEIIQSLFGPFQLIDILDGEYLCVDEIAQHLNAGNKTSYAVAAVNAEFPTAFIHPLRFAAVCLDEVDEPEEPDEPFTSDTNLFGWCDVNSDVELGDYLHRSPGTRA